jgi:PAS domain S-box-containing protein
MSKNILLFVKRKFKTIKIKLLGVFMLFTLIIVIVCFSCFRVYNETVKNEIFKDHIHSISSKILLLNKLELQFIIYDSKNNSFYLSGKSDYISKHHNIFLEISKDLDSLGSNKSDTDLHLLRNQLLDYNKIYLEFINKIKERGFRDYGIEGLMREYIHKAENYPAPINMEMLLTIRRNEKDYILRKDSRYIELHKQNSDILIKELKRDRRLSGTEREELLNLINQYQSYFQRWVSLDQEIGIDQGIGLKLLLKKYNEDSETLIEKISYETQRRSTNLNNINNIILLSTIGISVILSVILSLVFSSIFTKPIRVLSKTITQIVRSNFSKNVVIPGNGSKDEIGILFRNFNWMINQIHSHVDQINKKEKIIEESEKKFRALIEHSSDAIALTDKNARIIYASPSTKNVLGYLPEEVEGRLVTEFVHPDDLEYLHQCIKEVRTEPGKIVYIQLRKLHRDGSWRWLEGYSSNFLHEASVNAIITNYRDITSRKDNEIKIEEQYKELQRINSELDRFVYSASHDLKAPLTSILGIVKVARMDTEESSSLKYLTMAETNVTRLLRVIKDMTNFSRNARLNVTNELIDFNSIIKESIDTFTYLSKFKNISFVINVENSNDFFSDKLRIGILFNNFISNAILYHDVNKRNPFIHISITCFSNYASIVIEDNGEGIDPEYHSAIFNMFYRVSKDSEGSGLGLYIVKGIVEKLNGKIELISSPSEGTKFIITLPNEIGIVYNKSECEQFVIGRDVA